MKIRLSEQQPSRREQIKERAIAIIDDVRVVGVYISVSDSYDCILDDFILWPYFKTEIAELLTTPFEELIKNWGHDLPDFGEGEDNEEEWKQYYNGIVKFTCEISGALSFIMFDIAENKSVTHTFTFSNESWTSLIETALSSRELFDVMLEKAKFFEDLDGDLEIRELG